MDNLGAHAVQVEEHAGLSGAPRVDVVAPPASVTVRVIVAVPIWLFAGVSVTDRLAPLPPKTMLALGTRVVLLLEPDMVREAAAVSTSPMAKARAPVVASSLMT